ncbi:MAG: cell division ATPase MinD [archaeon]|nr:MAG: cell division ATPase MinD [archaeon]
MKRGKLVVLTSGKGGTGKTVSSINIAAALHALGKNVVLVDANLTTPNVSLHLGAPVVPTTLNHVLRGNKRVNQAVYEHHSGLKVVPASISVDALRKVRPEKFRGAVKKLKNIADLVIVDSSAGLGKEALMAIQHADELLVVTNPEIPAVTDALKTIKLAEKLKKKIVGVVVTRRRGRKEMSVKNVAYMLEKPIIGVVPEDESVPESIMLRDILVNCKPRSKAARSYKRIASRMVGEKFLDKPGFFESLFSWMKR